MCGISVIINPTGKKYLNASGLVKMNSIIKHRGLDDEGYLLFDSIQGYKQYAGSDTDKTVIKELSLDYLPGNERLGKVNLGFRRLSILDTSYHGHQPMSYNNGQYWIVFNGEIYNYIELKQELQRNGYEFCSNTDTEVIMAAYDRYGTECFNKFNGMWSFVLFDAGKNEIIASRDRFGIKPLYYYFDGNYLIFSSEIKQLLAVGNLNIQPNIPKIILDLNYDTREYLQETSYTNVYRFPKSHFLKLNIDSIHESSFQFLRYYQLEYLDDNNAPDFDQQVANNLSDEYLELLKSSVALRMRSDVPIGTCFSGGLDSSSIVFCMNEILKKQNIPEIQKTFTLVFSESDTLYCDESRFVDEIVNKLNVTSFKFEPTIEDVLSNIEKMVFAMDTPQHSTLMSYLFTYQLAKRNGVTVTLDGQGADELQAGYLPYYRYYSINNSFVDILKKFKNNFDGMEGANKEIFNGAVFSSLKNMRLDSITEYYLHKRHKQSPFKILNEKLFEDFSNNLETLFHYGDRGSMINSVESRFPMMDYRMVEFWMKMPSIYKIYNGYTKFISRMALNKKISDKIVWRRDKMGWEMPQVEWIKKGLGELMKKEIAGSDFLKEIGVNFDISSIDSSKSDHRYWKKTLQIYLLALWYRSFFIQFRA